MVVVVVVVATGCKRVEGAKGEENKGQDLEAYPEQLPLSWRQRGPIVDQPLSSSRPQLPSNVIAG